MMKIEKSKIQKTKLYKKIIDKRNIYYSIFSVNSYIFEKELLNKDDYELLMKLNDRFNKEIIDTSINKVKKKLDSVLLNDELFETSVYFRPKKIRNSDDKKFIDISEIVSRPIHTADLHTQIAIASILNAILLDENRSNNKIELNELGRILPNNFYGNIPSDSPNYLFIPWQKKYKEYSNIVKDAYSRYHETGEYRHELMIDLENFFPSIQPTIVYRKIIDILSVKYFGNELECLKIAIFKLLYLKVCNYKGGEYYYLKKSEKYILNEYYVQGIPQGLPQSYLFGNICMIGVAKVYEKIFGDKNEVKAYYYVDDSVIYTNKYKNSENSKLDFESDIEYLNSKLENLNIDYKYIKNEYPNCMQKNDAIKLNTILDYRIRAHETTGKSEMSEVYKEKIGDPNLSILGKVASLSSYELTTTFSDYEESTLKNKFNEFKKSIEAEIKRIDNISEGKDEFDNYRKYLVRYRKFMKFRERLLIDRQKVELEESYYTELLSKMNINKNSDNQLCKEDVESFFDEYSEDILVTEIFYILRNNFNKDNYIKIVDSINKFDEAVYSKDYKEVAYFSRVVKNMNVVSNLFKKNFNYYESIQKEIDTVVPEFKEKRSEVRRLKVNKLLSVLKGEKERKNFFSKLHCEFNNDGYFEWVNKGTDELYRQVLNVYVSKIYGIYINDNIKINRMGNQPIKYREFRIITFIRNKYFSMKSFSELAKNIYEDITDSTIDYSILDIIEHYVSFIKFPEYVDNLIEIHRFTNEMWKNGTKFLHFYTLHNQEHAIELIKGISSFIKSIDFFQISSLDYYILFISCYLHDISMVIHPDLIKIFNKEDNYESNIIVSDFKKRLSEILEVDKILYLVNSKVIKELLINYYKKVDEFFESNVRNRHAYESARFIRNNKQLNFIDRTVRDIVAEISEAHAYATIDIYDIKSIAKDSLVSKKYLKILLRIADLLDVCDNRIANAILLNNGSYMSDTTIFHWLSHQAISGYSIKTTYKNNLLENNKGEKKSYISKNAIEEKVELTFYLNIRHHVKVEKPKCCYCHSIIKEDNKNEMIIAINNNIEEICERDSCNLICKWMMKKNEYLFVELFSLQKYLRRTSSNFFDTKFEVKFQSNENARFLYPNEFELIENYIYKNFRNY